MAAGLKYVAAGLKYVAAGLKYVAAGHKYVAAGLKYVAAAPTQVILKGLTLVWLNFTIYNDFLSPKQEEQNFETWVIVKILSLRSIPF